MASECNAQEWKKKKSELTNGSYVLFNRQPSLHKMSMMSHRVKLMNYSSKWFQYAHQDIR